MLPVRTLIVSGSARAGSYNRKLAALAAASARAEGAEVTELDLRALALPLYDGDIEAAGIPAGALELRRLFASHEALIVASPEYNGFPPPLLFNAFDWATRAKATDGLPDGVSALGGTVAGLLSASPGGLGGLRSLIALRSWLGMGLGMLVVPQTLAVAKAFEAFDDHGALRDSKQQHGLETVVRSVLKTSGAARKPVA